jgi:hypothetical protein
MPSTQPLRQTIAHPRLPSNAANAIACFKWHHIGFFRKPLDLRAHFASLWKRLQRKMELLR